jgi:phospholipid-binding lipoprotein MlaA
LPVLVLAVVLAGCSSAERKASAASGTDGQATAEATDTDEWSGDADLWPEDEDLWPEDEEGLSNRISDPFRPVNHAFYVFNDRLYFWVLKPVSVGYGKVIPEIARIGLRNFFSNLGFLGRTVNCALQGDFRGSGTELARFGINTTVGVLGFGDPALHRWGFRERKEDFGQTFAVWGIGPGPYLDLPFFGPSSARELVGMVGDAVLAPVTYIPGVNVFVYVNNTSLQIGLYEDLKDAALDPYTGIRDAWYQQRIYLIEQRSLERIPPSPDDLPRSSD